MKRVTALLPASRMTDIVHALETRGERRISIVHGHGLLTASSAREQDFSVELGERITREVQIEVFCEDDRALEIVDLIRTHGRTALPNSGWVFVSDVVSAIPIDSATR